MIKLGKDLQEGDKRKNKHNIILQAGILTAKKTNGNMYWANCFGAKFPIEPDIEYEVEE